MPTRPQSALTYLELVVPVRRAAVDGTVELERVHIVHKVERLDFGGNVQLLAGAGLASHRTHVTNLNVCVGSRSRKTTKNRSR